jgi:hypothetical protein
VSGTVTLNGEPMGGANISFSPLEGNDPNTPGVDETGPSGNYKLMFKGRSGVAPGKYKVTISALPKDSSAGSVPDAFKDDPAMAGFAQEARQSGRGQKKAEAAGIKEEFERDVEDGGSVLNFDIKTKGSSSATEKSS